MAASSEAMLDEVAVPADQTHAVTVSCVDEEVGILTALKRLMHKQPYRLLTANSGNEDLINSVANALEDKNLRDGQELSDLLLERIHLFIMDTGASKVIYVSGTQDKKPAL